MEAAQQIPWWLDRFLIPVGFTLLGAVIGFAASQAKDWLDARRAKQAFLHAVGQELKALEEQLLASQKEVDEARQRYVEGSGMAPQFAATLRTTVFSSQLNKLRDLSEPIVMEVVKLYSDIGVLDRITELLNRQSTEAFKAASGYQQIAVASQIRSTLQALSGQLAAFSLRINEVRYKLPKKPAGAAS